jgi:hypothetical protein
MIRGGAAAPAWWLVAVYFVATSLGHLEFSLWLVRQRTWADATFAFKDAMPWLAIGGGMLLFFWIAAQMRKHREAALVMGGFWLVWGLSVALNDRFLTYSVNEYAHYPQYALLAWLVARALDPARQHWWPGRVIFWTALLGALDELQQYLWIAPSYGHYLDFNDFVVNLIAAAAGTMLYYTRAGDRPAPLLALLPARTFRCGWAVGALAGLGLFVALAFALGLVAISPPPGAALPPGGWVPSEHDFGTLYLQRASFWYQSWQPGVHRERYFVLTPWAGLLVMAASGAVYTALLHAAAFKRTLQAVAEKPAPGTDLR